MMRPILYFLLLQALLLLSHPTVQSFTTRSSTSFPSNRISPLFSAASEALLEALQSNPQDEKQLGTCIEDLEEEEAAAAASSPTNSTTDLLQPNFDPLIGLYEVSYVKTSRPRDNPVGGKWTRKSGIAQKLLKTRRSFQHILPTNTTGIGSLFGGGRKVVGEAVNVISLEALWGLIRISVILRGDAIPLTLEERTNTSRVVRPLSPFAVKALFDAPRIVCGKQGRIFNINVGPKTSVLLDTLFCDDNLRLGMGGTSGSRFVFTRCADDDREANEFRALLGKPPLKKLYSFTCLGTITALGIVGVTKGMLRFLSGTIATFAVLLAGLIAFSGGGIEADDMSVAMRKEGEAAAV